MISESETLETKDVCSIVSVKFIYWILKIPCLLVLDHLRSPQYLSHVGESCQEKWWLSSDKLLVGKVTSIGQA